MKRHSFAAWLVLGILSSVFLGFGSTAPESSGFSYPAIPSNAAETEMIASSEHKGDLPDSADTEAKAMQQAIENFYTLIIDTYHQKQLVNDPACLDLTSIQMRNTLTFLRNKTTIFALMSDYGISLPYLWHKPLVKLKNIRHAGNEAEVLIDLRLSDWREDEVLPEPVLPGENRFTLIQTEGTWKVRQYDTSSDALAREMLPADRLIDLLTPEEAEAEYSQVLSISEREAIDTLEKYYELFFLTYANQKLPDNRSAILDLSAVQMQNLERYWKNKLKLFAAAGLGPERWQVKPVGIKIEDFSAGKDRAAVSITLDVKELDPQEVLPEFVNPGSNRFQLRRIDGQLKVREFDTSADPLAALDIPAHHRIDLWSDETVQELLSRAD